MTPTAVSVLRGPKGLTAETAVSYMTPFPARVLAISAHQGGGR